MDGARVLIVDQDLGQGNQIVDLLQGQGYQAACLVPPGEEALLQAQEVRPDLVLVDLPPRQEEMAVRLAGQLQDKLGLPVVLMGDSPNPEVLELLGEARPYAYLPRTCRAETLKAALETALLRAQAEKQEQARRVGELQGELGATRRALKMLRTCGLLVARTRDPQELFEGICRNLVLMGGYRLAWIGRAETGPDRLVRPLAHYGFEQGYLERVRMTWGEGRHGSGPTGMALRSGHPAMARDLWNDPSYRPWREEAHKRGYASSIALPLSLPDGGKGVLNIYSGRVHAFDQGERDLLVDLASELSFASRALGEKKVLYESQRALRQSEDRFRLFVDATPAWEYWVGPDGRLMYISPACEEVTGYRPAEFLRDPRLLERIIHPQDRASYRAHGCFRFDSDRGNDPLDFRIVTKQGQERWISHWCRSVWDSQGRLLGQRVCNRDITHRKQMEQSLRAERNKLQGMLQALGEGMAIISSQYEIEYQNEALTQRFGQRQGQRCYRVFFGRDDPCNHCPLLEVISSGRPRRHQARARDGRTYEWSFSSFLDAEGQRKILVLVVDVSEIERILAEAMRASHLASLGELAAGVAHEINNPLNGIINYAQVIIDQAGKQRIQVDMARRIIKEGRRLARLVQGLLSFVREGVIERSPTHLGEVLYVVRDLLEHELRRDGIRLRLEVPAGLPRIIANPQQLQQVFLNLVSNARHALNQKYPGPHPDKRLDIWTEVVRDERLGWGWLRVVCHDHGVGIPAEIIDMVCSPFFSTKDRGEGTGLGLSISRQLVEGHGGRLSLESRLGEYTRVTVELPLEF